MPQEQLYLTIIQKYWQKIGLFAAYLPIGLLTT